MIKSNILLKNLYEQRSAHYISLKKNKDKSHFIISEQLYSKITHFIFELLQNAEDENATKIKISFNESQLVFEHNGKLFDINDITSITTFGGNERKKLKPNAIGRFGIGFKSVYSVTELPEIRSGNFHLTISNFIIPQPIDSVFNNTTKIILPFKSSATENHIVSKIETLFDNLDSTFLLFLNNITLIEIVDLRLGGNSRIIKIRRKDFMKSTLKLFTILENNNELDFLVNTTQILIGRKSLPIKIAFTINRKGSNIEFNKVDRSPIFAFFATEKETSLPFFIHAPFLTTPARDNITDDIRNQKLLIALANLMIDTIEKLKNNNLLSLRTWNVFPCNSYFYKNETYKLFYDKFTSYVKNAKTAILPTSRNSFAQVREVMIAAKPSLLELIDQKDAKKIFKKSEWVTNLIQEEAFSDTKYFFEYELDIPIINYRSLCENIDDSFFKQKSDNWLIKFYSNIADENSLWTQKPGYVPGPLRNKAFIRTSSNKQVKPFDEDGNLNVFLPIEGSSDYQFVKNVFLEDKDAKRLFKILNVSKPDIIAETIEYIIPRIEKESKPYNGLKKDLQKLFRAIRKAEGTEEKTITKKLTSIKWLPSINKIHKNTTLNKASDLYFPTKELSVFFQKSPLANFVDINYFTDKKNKNILKSALAEFGVFFRPRRFYKMGDRLVYEDLSNNKLSIWNTNIIELEGLEEFLSKINNKKASLLLWKIIADSIGNWQNTGFNKTKFLQNLKQNKWLFNKYGQRLNSSEITPSELDEAYEESPELIKYLEFKPDEIKEFELTHNVKVIDLEEYESLKNEKSEWQKRYEELKNKYEPTLEEEEENDLPELEIGNELTPAINIEDVAIPNGYQIDFYVNQSSKGATFNFKNSIPSKRQVQTGQRGEDYILKLLNNQYKTQKNIEIKVLNETDKLGVGCDFLILQNGELIKLIEVKSTEGGYDNCFKISLKQWALAIKAYQNKSEPEYNIYCVYYTKSARPNHILIKDPIEWMLYGKLRIVELIFNVGINTSN